MEILRQHPDFPQVLHICETLRKNGYVSKLAGGCVRDGLLGRKPKDIDIATDARPEAVEALFPKTLSVGKQFGVIIVIQGEIQVEVATFRSDGNYSDGRHPDSVTFSSPKEDAARRDFTINAMFMDPFTGEVEDFFGGKADLQKRVIRTVGVSRKRFDEDKLRMLRAVRFASELGFEIAPDTLQEIQRRPKDIVTVSAERIFEEISKLLKGDFRGQGLRLLVDSGLSGFVFSGLKLTPFLDDLCGVVEAIPPGCAVALWTATSGIDSSIRERKYDAETLRNRIAFSDMVLKNLKSSNQLRANVKSILESEALLIEMPELSVIKKIAAEVWARDFLVFATVIEKLGKHLSAEALSKIQSLVDSHFILPERWVTGEDLKALGISPGPKMGRLIEEAYDRQLEEVLADKKQALEWIKTQSC